MNNLGKHIATMQNTDNCIQYLAAQKWLYSLGKRYFTAQAIIAVPIPIAISLLTPYLGKTQERIAWVFILFSIIATIAEMLFDSKASDLKKEAALIQEKFDCAVLKIEWNTTLLTRRPDEEVVYRNYQKLLRATGVQKLFDWYSPNISAISTNLATLICQRTNCAYDFNLRKKYSTAVLLVAVSTFTLLMIISCSYGLSLTAFITAVIFPSLPVFVLAYKQISSNAEAMSALTDLKGLIESQLDNAGKDTIVAESLIRQIQDQIYHKRILSPLLPDWVYNLLRERLEEEMHFSIKHKIDELLKSK